MAVGLGAALPARTPVDLRLARAAVVEATSRLDHGSTFTLALPRLLP